MPALVGGRRAVLLSRKKVVVANPSAAPSVGTTVTPALYIHFDYGVTLNGSTIASVVDQSANGYVFNQATTGSQPPLVTNAYNGHACARFSGAQYLASAVNLAALASTNFTIMAIGTNLDTSGAGSRRLFYNRAGATGFGIGEDSSWRWACTDEAADVNVGIAAGNSALHMVMLRGDSAGNNLGYADSTTGQNLGGSTRAVNTTGFAGIGGTFGGGGLWKGDCCCIVGFPSALSGADLTALLTFSRTQFGTP